MFPKDMQPLNEATFSEISGEMSNIYDVQ